MRARATDGAGTMRHNSRVEWGGGGGGGGGGGEGRRGDRPGGGDSLSDLPCPCSFRRFFFRQWLGVWVERERERVA